MKHLMTLACLGLVALSHNASAAPDSRPVVVPTTFSTLYVPGGFDSNDNVQFVGEGYFQNSCFRPADPQVQVDHVKKEIKVAPRAYHYGGLCLQLMLPFDRVIETGPLEAGTYRISETDTGAKIGDLSVRPSLTNNPDDHIYAPISQALFRQKGDVAEIVISGEFPSSCMKLTTVTVEVEPKVLVVLPIAEMENRADCQPGRYPFSRVTKIDDVPKGRYLLHVRSMNAKAINSLVQMN